MQETMLAAFTPPREPRPTARTRRRGRSLTNSTCRMSLRICFIASEVAPLAKTGGLADVAGALPRYLHRAGTRRARVHAAVLEHRHRGARMRSRCPALQDVELRLGRASILVLAAAKRGCRVPTCRCISCIARQAYDRPSIYTDGARRASALPGAAACRARSLPATGLRAADRALQRLAHGAGADAAEDRLRVGPPVRSARARSVDPQHRLSGRVRAPARPTTSAATSGPLLSPETLAGAGTQLAARRRASCRSRDDRQPDVRQGDLHARGRPWPGWRTARARRRRRRHSQRRRLCGMESRHRSLPETSLQLRTICPARRRPSARCSTGSTCRSCGATPLLGIVSRMTVQKGFDLLFDSLPEILAQARSVPGRAGQRRIALRGLLHGPAAALSRPRRVPSRLPRRARAPDRSGQRHVPDAVAVRAVRAESDVQPEVRHGADRASHRRPRRLGADVGSATRQGTGIVFNDFDAPAMRWALHTALDLFKDRDAWAQLMRNGMAQDFSWDQAGTSEYERAAMTELIGE